LFFFLYFIFPQFTSKQATTFSGQEMNMDVEVEQITGELLLLYCGSFYAEQEQREYKIKTMELLLFPFLFPFLSFFKDYMFYTKQV
jgi:hypothetical protein